MTRHHLRAGHLAAGCVALLTLTGASSAQTTVVHVTMWDMGGNAEMSMDRGIGMAHAGMTGGMMGMKLSADTVPAGDVKFEVSNGSKDTVHEMLVLPLPADGAALPYSAKDARFDEEKAGSLGEVEELQPGKSGDLTLTLKPGKYALACNVANHFANGMWTVLTVK
jgi:uncharacterized cupredoxin-like copper-binding protein